MIGWICVAIGLPAMFGYIIAGVLVGSDGFNLVKVGCTFLLEINKGLYQETFMMQKCLTIVVRVTGSNIGGPW